MSRKVFGYKDITTKISTAVVIILLLYFAHYSIRAEPEWFLDNIFSIFITLLFYFIHKKIEVTKVVYPFALLIIIFHNLGTFGFYSKPFFSVEWDFITHLYSGIILSLISYHYFNKKLRIKTSARIILTVLVVMGFVATTEIFEVLGTLIYGSGEGFLQYGDGDLGLFDTQTDLLYDFLGIFVGLGIYHLSFLIQNKK